MSKPEAYHIHYVQNMWKAGQEHKRVAFFWPCFVNAEGFMDADGNSDIDGAKAYELDERRKKENEGVDRNTMLRYKAERPFDPQEATLLTTRNIFAVDMLIEHLANIESSPVRENYGRNGYTYRDSDGKVRFRESDKVTPLDKFPWRGSNSEGCTTIYDSPVIIGGTVPGDLYLLNIDPYYHDHSSGPSLGSVYVYKRVNNFSHFRQDTFAASYVGRPETLELFLMNAFMLAEYYNCKICFENDKGKSIIEYARRHKCLGMLQPEFEFGWSTTIKRPSMRRGYGYAMGRGKDDIVRITSEQYYADWLITERFIDEQGKAFLNLHTIYDKALLQETIEYGSGGNYDRVDTILGIMLYIRERIGKQPMLPEPMDEENFFSKERTRTFFKQQKWY